MLTTKPHPYLIIFALWLLMFSASSQVMIIAPILPQIGQQLNIPKSVQGTLVSAYAVLLAIFALITGPVSDKIGRRRILMIGTGSMAFALLLHSFVFDYFSLLVVRALAGAAGGILSGSCVAYVGDYFPYQKRGWANGWISTGIATGQIIGIPFGTVLAEWFGFHAPFAMFAMSMYLAFMLIWLVVPQPNVQRSTIKLTFKNALSNYARMITVPHIAAAAGVYGLMYLGISLFVVYLPTWLKSQLGVSGYEIASLFFVGGIATVLTGPQAGKLSDRIGRKKLVLTSCVGLALVMATTTLMLTSIWIAYGLFFLAMILIAARLSPFQALISEIISDEKRGAMMSFSIALGQVGMGLGGALAGFAYTGYGYFSNTILAALSVLLMAFLIWRFIAEPELSSEPELEEAVADSESIK